MMRPSTLAERRKFYEELHVTAILQWLKVKPQFYAFDLGYDSGISTAPSKALRIIGPNITLQELQKKALKYLPEDIYYDTTQYKDPAKCLGKTFSADPENIISKELVFDVDAKSIQCECKECCERCIRICLRKAEELKHWIQTSYHYENVRIVYSGKGAHVHVNDPAARTLTPEQRKKIAQDCKDFAIDPWVTTTKRLIRLPYTLHGEISRVCLPVKDVNTFRPELAVPRFMT